MIALFNALIVVMVRQGKDKEVLDVVHEFTLPFLTLLTLVNC
jgi:hypothetical protein